VCAACLKNSVRIFVEKISKMVFLEGSVVPVLYIGRTVPLGLYVAPARRGFKDAVKGNLAQKRRE
jgi:hypothetical protein